MATDIPSGVETSSTPPPPAGAVPVYQVPSPGSENEKRIDFIKVHGHSNLFYWWPLWLMCFILAGWTYADGGQMAVLPAGAEVATDGDRETITLPAGKAADLPAGKDAANPNPLVRAAGSVLPSQMTVSRSNRPGILFAFTILLVAVVSSLVLRGLVSLVALIAIIAVVLALALFNLWDDVFRFFGGLDIRMNAAGYLFIGVPLFLLWVAAFTIYDRQSYVVFDEGQIRYVREVGESEIVLQAERTLVEKKRSDVFRHWLIGFGTGDLVIRAGGNNGQEIELENVVNINRKLEVINYMLQHKAVT
jgi:hypothetical protein